MFAHPVCIYVNGSTLDPIPQSVSIQKCAYYSCQLLVVMLSSSLPQELAMTRAGKDEYGAERDRKHSSAEIVRINKTYIHICT